MRKITIRSICIILLAALALGLVPQAAFAKENSYSYDDRYAGLLGQGLNHDPRFDGCIKRYGIDVSKYQGDIDWAKAKAAGVEFAVIRVGYRGYEYGSLNEDPKAERNFRLARENGVKVGAYFYSQAITVAEARAEADYTISLLESYGVEPDDMDLPIVMDVEFPSENGHYTGRLYNANLSNEVRTNVTLAFLERVEQKGYRACLYGSRSALSGEIKCDMSKIEGRYPVWMAAYTYTRTAGYTGEYSIWQHSCKGKVDGISGPVDLDVWYDDGLIMNRYAKCSGVALNLEGNMDCLFYVKLPEYKNGWTAKTYFESDGFKKARNTVVLNSSDTTVYNASKDRFTVRCTGIEARQMTMKARLKIYDEKGRQIKILKDGVLSDHIDYSVSDWANYMIKNGDSKNVSLAKALLNYGQTAQDYFGYNLSSPANPKKYLSAEMGKVAPDPAYDMEIVSGASKIDKVKFKGSRLNLLGDTELMLMFSSPDPVVTWKKIIPLKQYSSTRWYASIPNIASKDLGTKRTVSISCSGNTVKIKYCVLTWANLMLNDPNASKKNKDMAKALYLYYKAASAYFSTAE